MNLTDIIEDQEIIQVLDMLGRRTGNGVHPPATFALGSNEKGLEDVSCMLAIIADRLSSISAHLDVYIQERVLNDDES
jgi:hypothetical protein